MLYNKRQFRKANDKKVLRKVGKQWKTVSLALLMAIGGVGIATQVSHASAVNNNNRPNVNNQNTLKERLNSSLQKTTPSNRSVTANHSQSNVQRTPQISTQNITNQASALHNRIIRNASQFDFNAQGQKQQTGSSVQRTVNSNQNNQNNNGAVQKAIAQSAAARNQQAASNQSGSAAPASGSSVQTSNGSKVNTSAVSVDNPVNTGNQADTKDATGKNAVKTNDQRNNQTVNGPKEEPTNMPNVGDPNTVTVNYMYDGSSVGSHAFHKGDVINADDLPGLQSGFGINPDPKLATQSYMIGQNGIIIGQDNNDIRVDRTGMWGSAHWYSNTDNPGATVTIANGQMTNSKPEDNGLNGNNIKWLYTYNTIAPSDCGYLFSGTNFGESTFNNLVGIDLSGFDTDNVHTMHDLFHGSTNLQYYNFTGVNTSKVSDMSCMFDDDDRATNLDLNWMNTSSCHNFSQMFWNMPMMQDLDIQKFVVSDNASVGSMLAINDGGNNQPPVPNNTLQLRELVIGQGVANKLDQAGLNSDDNYSVPSGAWVNTTDPSESESGLNALAGSNKPGAWIDANDAVSYHIKYEDVLTGNTVATKTGHTVLGLDSTKTGAKVTWVPVNNIYLPKDKYGHKYRFVPAQGMTVPVTVPNQEITVNVFDPQPNQDQNSNDNIKYANVWGRTNWFLYGNGLLRLVDNSMETNQAPNSSSDDLKDNMSQFPVHTLKVTNAVAPGDASGTFSGHQNDFNQVSDLDVNNLNTTSTYKMDSMMSDMPNVKNMDLSNWSTNGVQSMNNMFASDTNLTNLNVSGFKMGPNTSTTNMFNNTNKLQSITIGSDTRFGNDSSMSQNWIDQDTGAHVNLEDGNTHPAGTYYNGDLVNTQKVNVEYTFGPNVIESKAEYLPKGTTVDKASVNPPNKHWILDPNDSPQIGINNGTLAVNLDRFGHWGSANWYMDDQGNMKLYNSANGNSMLTNQWNGPQNEHSDKPDVQYKNMVRSISTSDVAAPANSTNLFQNLPNLQSVNFSGLNAANTTSFNHMLASDPQLSDVENLGHLSTGSDADMTGMLTSDGNLKSIDLTGIDTGKVQNFNSMFANDKVLSDVGLGGASIANANTMQSMFANDPQLRALDLSGFDNSNPGNINMTNMFQNDNLLSELKMPDHSQFNFSGKNFKSTGIPFFSNNKHSHGSNSTDDINNGTQSADTYYYGNDDIIVNYINETGQTLHTDDILGRLEDPVDIFTTKDTNGSDGNPDPSDYTIDRKDTKSDYTFLNHPQHVTVPLIGKYTDGRQYQASDGRSHLVTKNYNNQSDDNDKVTLTFNEVNSDGQKINSLGTKLIHVKGQIGNDVSVNPSDYLSDVNGSNGPEYVVASDSNGSTVSYYLQGNGRNRNGKPDTATLYGVNENGAPYQLNDDGSLKKDGNGDPILIPANRNVTFDYIANPNYSKTVGNLIVTYKDHNNNQIGSTDTITPKASDYGQSIDVTDPNSTLPSDQSAKGEAVPAGYHIDAAQPTRYTITHSDQHITLNVDGNPETTNNNNDSDLKLPITVKVINHQPNGSTETDYYTSKTNFQKNTPTSQQPNISSKVGQSVVIDASTYQPQINSNQIINNSDSSYKINFTTVQKGQKSVPAITATKNDGTTVKNLNTNGITFTYNLYQQEAPRYTNTIHYISSSDIDNSDDITRQPGQKTPFLTKVSDRGKQGDTFSDKYYRENVPIGYQFYKVYSVNGNRVDGTNSSGISGFGNGKASDHGNQDEVIEVIPNAKPIHIHYINQNGSDLKDYTSDGITAQGQAINSIDTGDKYTTKFGTQISDGKINQSDKGDKNSIGVPQGYHYAALNDSQNQPINPEAQPTFSRDEQNVYIPIVGNTYPVKVQIRRNTTDANGHSDYSVVSDTINKAQVGHEYTLYGFNFTPTNQNAGSGYTIDTSNGHPFKVTVKIDPNGQYHYVDDASDSTGGDALNDKSQNIDNKEIGVDNQGNPNNGQNPANFWFTVSNNVSKPLHLVYVNQAGQKVGCSDKIQGTIGTQINVTDPSKGGEPIPKGYQLTDGITNRNQNQLSDVTGKDQDTTYQLSNHEQTVFLHVTGQPIKASVKIYKVLEDSDGHQHVMPGSETISGDLGSSVEVNPSDYLKELPGNSDRNNNKNYQVDYNRDSTQFVRLSNSSEDPTKGIATPNRIVFYYRSSQTSGAPITVRYINDKTGQQVSDSYTDVMNGNLNTDADVTSVAAGGEAVPNGYSIDSSKLGQLGHNDGSSDAPKYKFSTSPRNLNIPVKGDTLPQSDTFTLQVVKRDPDEDATAQVSDVRLKINGQVGDTFTISPYGFSDGENNGSKQIITGMQGNGVTSNGSSDHWSMPSGYHAVDSDADLKIQIRPDGTLAPLSNTSYTYVANYDPIDVGTVKVHYVTSDTGASSDGQSSSIPTSTSFKSKLGSGLKELDVESDRGIVPDSKATQAQVIQGNQFDLTPYKNDIPETVSHFFDYQIDKSTQPVDANGNPITNDQWSFSHGTKDVYIKVDKKGDQPIIID